MRILTRSLFLFFIVSISILTQPLQAQQGSIDTSSLDRCLVKYVSNIQKKKGSLSKKTRKIMSMCENQVDQILAPLPAQASSAAKDQIYHRIKKKLDRVISNKGA